jgi:hypothetical protein
LDRKARLFAVLVFAGALFLLYFMTLTRFYSTAGIMGAMKMEMRYPHMHEYWLPQHLLWNAAGTFLFRALSMAGWNGLLIAPLQVVNAVLSSLGVVLFCLSLELVIGASLPAFLLSLLLAFDFGFWSYAVDCKMYAHSAFWALLTLYLAIMALRGRSWAPAAAGISSAVSILFHITNTSLSAAVFLALLTSRAGKDRLRVMAWFCLPLFLILAFAFGGIYLGWGEGVGFISWLVGPARITQTYPPLLPVHPWANLGSFISHLSGSFTGQGWWPGISGQGGLPVLLLNSFAVSFFPFFIFLVALSIFSAARRGCLFRGEGLLFLSWMLFFLAEIFFIDPGNNYKYIAAVPLAGLVALGLSETWKKKESRPATVSVFVLLSALLCLTNAVLRIEPAHRESSNYTLMVVKALSPWLSANDTVISPGVCEDALYFEYFVRCRSISVYQAFRNEPGSGSAPENRLRRWIDEAPGRVFVHSAVFNQFSYTIGHMDEGCGLTADRIKSFFDANYILSDYREARIGGNREVLFEVLPKRGRAR